MREFKEKDVGREENEVAEIPGYGKVPLFSGIFCLGEANLGRK